MNPTSATKRSTKTPAFSARGPTRGVRLRSLRLGAGLLLAASVALTGCSDSIEIPSDPIVLNQEVVRTAQHGNHRQLAALIEAGGDATQRDFLGWTPLHYAVNRFRDEGYSDMRPVEVLLDAPGVDIDSRTNDATSALTLAARYGRIELLELLLERGAALEMKEGDGSNVLVAALREDELEMAKHLLAKGVDVNENLPGGGNALFIAIRNRNIEAMRMLIDAGVDVHGGGKAAPPIIFAAAVREVPVVELLIDAGADVNAINPVNGLTPLHRAIGSGAEMVELLLEAGAKPGVSNQEGYTPLDFANERGDQEVVRLLTEARS